MALMIKSLTPNWFTYASIVDLHKDFLCTGHFSGFNLLTPPPLITIYWLWCLGFWKEWLKVSWLFRKFLIVYCWLELLQWCHSMTLSFKWWFLWFQMNLLSFSIEIWASRKHSEFRGFGGRWVCLASVGFFEVVANIYALLKQDSLCFEFSGLGGRWDLILSVFGTNMEWHMQWGFLGIESSLICTSLFNTQPSGVLGKK